MNVEALLRLVRKRQSAQLPEYFSVSDFHGGVYECDHVSPWAKSGCNVDADVMISEQDWWRREDAMRQGD